MKGFKKLNIAIVLSLVLLCGNLSIFISPPAFARMVRTEADQGVLEKLINWLMVFLDKMRLARETDLAVAREIVDALDKFGRDKKDALNRILGFLTEMEEAGVVLSELNEGEYKLRDGILAIIGASIKFEQFKENIDNISKIITETINRVERDQATHWEKSKNFYFEFFMGEYLPRLVDTPHSDFETFSLANKLVLQLITGAHHSLYNGDFIEKNIFKVAKITDDIDGAFKYSLEVGYTLALQNLFPNYLLFDAVTAIKKFAQDLDNFKVLLNNIRDLYLDLNSYYLDLNGYSFRLDHLPFHKISIFGALPPFSSTNLFQLISDFSSSSEEFIIGLEYVKKLVEAIRSPSFKTSSFIYTLFGTYFLVARGMDEFKEMIDYVVDMINLNKDRETGGAYPEDFAVNVIYSIYYADTRIPGSASFILQHAVEYMKKGGNPLVITGKIAPKLAEITTSADEFYTWFNRMENLGTKIDLSLFFPILFYQARSHRESLPKSMPTQAFKDVAERNLIHLIEYFRQNPQVDWDNFAARVEVYIDTFWGGFGELDKEILDILTDQTIAMDGSIERIKDLLVERIELEIEGLELNSDDKIALVHLARLFPDRHIVPPTLEAIELIAEGGNIYNFLQNQDFYQNFLATSGLKEEFDTPGVKFELVYDKIVQRELTVEDLEQVTPIQDDIEAMVDLIINIKEDPEIDRGFKNRLKSIIEEVLGIEGETTELESHLNQDNIKELSLVLINEISLSNLENKSQIVLKLIEIYSFNDTEPIRNQISEVEDDMTLRLSLIRAYWRDYIQNIARELIGVTITEKFYYDRLAGLIRQYSEISLYTGKLTFELWDRRIADLAKSYSSQDCGRSITEYTVAVFGRTIGHIVDPAVQVFRIKEDDRWVGNVTTVVTKDNEGNAVLLIDAVQMQFHHPLSEVSNSKLDNFTENLILELRKYAAQAGFDYVVISSAPSSRIWLANSFKRVFSEAKKEEFKLRKGGDDDHFGIIGIGNEYLWSYGLLRTEYDSTLNPEGRLVISPSRLITWRKVDGYRVEPIE